MLHGIEFIEVIHYYLCYKQHSHLRLTDLHIFRKQSNILYYTSRISREMSKRILKWNNNAKDIVYFISYLFTISYLLDIQICNIRHLFLLFNIYKSEHEFAEIQLFFFKEINYNFAFLQNHPTCWTIYKDFNCLESLSKIH